MNLRSARLTVALLFVFVFGGSLLLQAGARRAAGDLTIDKNEQTTTIECKSDAVNVKGERNKLTLTGDCTKVTVSGHDNVITATSVKELDVPGHDNSITLDLVGKITTPGDDNNIVWKNGMEGKAPEITGKGKDNKVAQGRR
jgi:hypothetical protein